jgi:hypothetical protein
MNRTQHISEYISPKVICPIGFSIWNLLSITDLPAKRVITCALSGNGTWGSNGICDWTC